MIFVIDYDAIYHELQAKRKFLDDSIQSMKDQNDNKINQTLFKKTTEQLNQLNLEKKSLTQKYTDYLNRVKEITDRNKNCQSNLQQKESKLYQIKTSLQSELLAFIPSVGLRHKRILQQEQVHIKIQRHQHQNEERLKQQQQLRGIGEQEMQYISSNLSKYVNNIEINSPKKDDNFENGSLVMSKSFNQSQLKQGQQPSQISQNLTPVVQNKFQQKPLRGQISSQLQYGGDYKDDKDDNDDFN